MMDAHCIVIADQGCMDLLMTIDLIANCRLDHDLAKSPVVQEIEVHADLDMRARGTAEDQGTARIRTWAVACPRWICKFDRGAGGDDEIGLEPKL